MCGIAGAVGTLTKNEQDAFSNLLFMASFRGMDSTGIACSIRPKPGQNELVEPYVLKVAVPPPDFLDMTRAKDAIKSADWLLMGHARSRTVGDVNKKNAQPFDFENVTGTHNGTLHYSAKNRLEGAHASFGTDSEALYYRLNKDGIDGVAKLTDKDDAMALAWFNKADKTINLYRNEKRPLYYTFNKKNTAMFYASEAGMLYLALNRNGVDFTKIKMLPENLYLSYKVPEKGGAAFQKSESRFCAQSFKAPAQTVTYSQRSFQLGSSSTNGNGVGSMASTTGQSERSNTVLMFPTGQPALTAAARLTLANKFRMDRMNSRPEEQGGDFYKGRNGQQYTPINFENKMAEGCAVCGESPAWGEPVKFLKDDNFLCSSCTGQARTQAESGKMDGTTLTLMDFLS